MNVLKTLLIVLLHVIALVPVPAVSLAQQQLVDDPEVYEKTHFQQSCKTADFGPGFIKRIDINNDGLTDVVTDNSELTCDGMRGPSCNADGCAHNFYVQVKEGGYIMIATAQIYDYDFVQRFGNMVFVLKMHPRFCDRTNAAPCEMTVRVRGGRFLTISKK
jgi:hypothetical protein